MCSIFINFCIGLYDGCREFPGELKNERKSIPSHIIDNKNERRYTRKMIYRNQISPPGAAVPSVPAPNAPSTPSFTGIIEGEQLALISNLRQLWIQLAIWSRSLIVSIAGNLGDVQMVTDRLTYLPEAFSGILGQYFEPQGADRFRELLEEHISAMAALFSAEKNNDDQTVNQETKNLYNNAGRMASYLVSINSFWNRDQWTQLLNDYIEILLADLVARMEGDFAKEIDIFDDLQTQAIKIADYMAQGMTEKFHP